MKLRKEQLLAIMLADWEAHGMANWRQRAAGSDPHYLVIRVVSEPAALAMARREFVHCTDLNLAALALECCRLVRSINLDDDGLLVNLEGADAAALYRDVPITEQGYARFQARYEVSHFLDMFTSEIGEVLEGKRASIWPLGSDNYGIPAESDILLMVGSGRYSSRMIRLLGQVGHSSATTNMLRKLTSAEDAWIAATALSVLDDLGEPLDIDRALCLAADTTKVAAASTSTKLLAKCAMSGQRRALIGLLGLSRVATWLDLVDPRWKRWPIETADELLEAIAKETQRRSKPT